MGKILDNYPAQIAGLKKGDVIVKISSTNVQSWEEVQKQISTSPVSTLKLVILREGQRLEKTIISKEEVSQNIFGQKENVRRIGIAPAEEIVVLKYSFVESLVKSYSHLAEITFTTYKALYRMATGAMSPKDTMTGPVGIFFIIQKAASLGFSYLMYIVGVISASLAIFNLLPLPVLDGGHLFLLAIEKVRGKHLPVKVEETITRIGFSLIICLAVFVFYNDFDRLGWISHIKGFWHQIGF